MHVHLAHPGYDQGFTVLRHMDHSKGDMSNSSKGFGVKEFYIDYTMITIMDEVKKTNPTNMKLK